MKTIQPQRCKRTAAVVGAFVGCYHGTTAVGPSATRHCPSLGLLFNHVNVCQRKHHQLIGRLHKGTDGFAQRRDGHSGDLIVFTRFKRTNGQKGVLLIVGLFVHGKIPTCTWQRNSNTPNKKRKKTTTKQISCEKTKPNNTKPKMHHHRPNTRTPNHKPFGTGLNGFCLLMVPFVLASGKQMNGLTYFTLSCFIELQDEYSTLFCGHQDKTTVLTITACSNFSPCVVDKDFVFFSLLHQ